MNIKNFLYSQRWPLLLGSAFILILFLHVWHIADLPRGLHLDESSEGYNASLIAQNLHDQYGKFLPVLFKAFGEYRNPMEIYAMAIVFKLFGVSFFTLRLTSVLFFGIFLLGFYALCKRLFPDQKIIQLYAILAAGCLPWLFYFSRIATDLLTQPAVMIWFLYFLHQSYHGLNKTKSQQILSASLSGFLLGISVYSYATSRLFAFTTLIIFLWIYGNKRYWRLHLNFLIAFFVALIPYVIFILRYPGALTTRFSGLSYLYHPSLSLKQKIFTFISFYFEYWSPGFLLWRGDLFLRHNSGLGICGELSICVAFLAIIGLCCLWSTKQYKEKKFEIFLLFNLIVAPTAAALTEINHSYSSPRCILMGVYALCFSLYGFRHILTIHSKKWRLIFCTGLFALLLIQGFMFMKTYYTKYPKISENAFENYNLAKVIQEALSQHPKNIIVSDRGSASVELQFYRRAMHLPDSAQIMMALPIAKPQTCIIYYDLNPFIQDEQLFQISYKDVNNISKLKCFGPRMTSL